MMQRIVRSWIAILVFLTFLVPASEAGQVQVVARSGCDTIPSSITPDARFVTVWTCANHLFLVDRNGGPSALINHASGSSAPANAGARFPILSADGAFVAFRSTANNLVPGQTDSVGTDNVFLYERATGANTLISQRLSPGAETNTLSGAPSISGDGRYVVFESEAQSLVPGQVDSPGTNDLFLYDRVAGALTLITHAAGSPATTANGRSERAVISRDGAFIAFSSEATNLVSGQFDGNNDSDIFLYDRASGITTLVSHANGSSTTAASGLSFGAEINPDGRYVAFTSNSSNLVAGQADPALSVDVFLFDRIAGTTRIVSHKSGAPAATGSGNSGRPSMSDDGRYIAFDSDAGDLAPGTTETASNSLDIFVWDRDSGTTTLVSHAPGAPNVAASSSYGLRISGDGSFVAFISDFKHLPGQTTNSGMPDLFLFDRSNRAITLVTRSYLSPTQDANDGFYPFDKSEWFLDADGSDVIFASLASDLEPGDTNSPKDVWAFDNGIPGHFHTLAPCRLLDTRTPEDGPALQSGSVTLLALHGSCGIPATAKALALNVTIAQASHEGQLTIYPGDATLPPTSTINFGIGQTRNNNAIAPLASNANGTLALRPFLLGNGTVHVVLDVTGYSE
ncbi:MAG TPA: hypothetical protein VFR31_18250 [Thermoanaerobaculia bacterium]|nr:hypothetical protein [Thermoanaerobaculia bacterium]